MFHKHMSSYALPCDSERHKQSITRYIGITFSFRKMYSLCKKPKSVCYFIVFFTERRSAESVKVKSARQRKRKRLQKKQKKSHATASTCSSVVADLEEKDAQHDGVQVNVPVSAEVGHQKTIPMTLAH